MVSQRPIDTVEGAIPGRRRGIVRSIRGHHIYFLLAAFDLAAVGTGLWLSHRLNGMLAANVASSEEWGAVQRNISVLRRAAAEATAPGNDVFASGDLEGELATWDARAAVVEGQLAALETDLLAGLPPEDTAGARHYIAELSAAYDDLAVAETKLFDLYRRGQHATSAPAVALMNRESGKLLSSVDRLANFLHDTQLMRLKTETQSSLDMQRLEYLVAAMVVLMVTAITIFGRGLGLSLQRQYEELEQAHACQQDLVAQVRASHDDIVSLNDELRFVNDALEERIAERTREIVAANASISSLNRELTRSLAELEAPHDEIEHRGRMADLGRFAARLAHEFRDPLRAVRSAARSLDLGAEGRASSAEAALASIEAAVRHCEAVIDKLEDGTRSGEIATKAVLIDDWIKALIERQRTACPDPVRLDLKANAPGSVVELDPERMGRVVGNLVTNAVEALAGPGEWCRAQADAEPTITIETAVRGGEVLITVTDNGPGIAEDLLGRAMEPLVTTKICGAGLGLPAAEDIVRQHGGRLDIESEPGRGTRASARFPARRTGLKAAHTKGADSPGPIRSAAAG